jgi:hypothetical protein
VASRTGTLNMSARDTDNTNLETLCVIAMIDARVMIGSLMVVGWGKLNRLPELMRSNHGVKHDE